MPKKKETEIAEAVTAQAVAESTESVAPVTESAKPAAKTRRATGTKKASTTRSGKEATATEKIQTKVIIELADRSASADDLVERAKADWVAKGCALEDMHQLAVYVNANEGMVYYVVGDDYLSGSFAI